MIPWEKYVEHATQLTEADFQWTSVSSEFHEQTPSFVIDKWIKHAKQDLALEAFTTGWVPAFQPEVLIERGGGGTGVRIRMLVTRLTQSGE